MFEYIIRRLLLMIPVFFGSTLLVFYILQSVPDGPFEQAVKQIKMAQMASGEGGATTSNSDGVGGRNQVYSTATTDSGSSLSVN